MAKNQQITVQGINITIQKKNDNDYISLTDMVSGFDGGSSLIEKWLRNKNTLEFLAVWENLNNSNFDFDSFRNITKDIGTNRFLVSVKKFVHETNAIGIYASAGRYGATFAHKEISIEFSMWLNQNLKLEFIKKISLMNDGYETLFNNLFSHSQNTFENDKCYVYLMQELTTNLYKIGISKYPIIREKTLQSSKPTIKILYFKEFEKRKEAFTLEKNLHELFKTNRIRGEWFMFGLDEINKLKHLLQ